MITITAAIHVFVMRKSYDIRIYSHCSAKDAVRVVDGPSGPVHEVDQSSVGYKSILEALSASPRANKKKVFVK